MIEFLTLFLTLSTGLQPVELSVSGAVATIELRLDGELVTVLESEPWAFDCDLGPELIPHELVAIVRDETGRELDRATQWINFVSQTSGASLRFENGANGLPKTVGVVWEAVGDRRPSELFVTFDGQPLKVKNIARIPLPSYDPAELHFIEATLRFGDEAPRQVTASFGGLYGEEVTTELTGLPVITDDPGRLRRDGDTLFLKNGRPIAIHGVEKGVAEVIMVRDPTASPGIESLVEAVLKADPRTNPTKARSREARAPQILAQHARFRDVTRLSFVSPYAMPVVPGRRMTIDMFAHSERPEAGAGALWQVRAVRPRRFPVRLAEAVAVAGRAAHAGGKRRAVVLLLGDGEADPGFYTPAAVGAYLSALRVPLIVWSTAPGRAETEWGEALYVGDDHGSTERLAKAVIALEDELRSQRIVWFEGRHRPQSIEPVASSGLRLAGWGVEREPGSVRSRDEEALKALPASGDAPAGEELTPLVVQLDPGMELPAANDMATWFRKDGAALVVERVERGPAEVIFVRDPVVQPPLDHMAEAFYLKTAESAAGDGRHFERLRGAALTSWLELDEASLGIHEAQVLREARDHLRAFASLGDDVSPRFMAPIAAPISHVRSEREIFWRDGPYESSLGGLLRLLDQVTFYPGKFRVADALIAAGRELFEGQERRALVLVLASSREDESWNSQARALAKLRAFDVPLFVWWYEPSRSRPEWDETRRLDVREETFAARIREVRTHLESQRLVWIRGGHLPARIELSADAVGVRKIGGLVPSL